MLLQTNSYIVPKDKRAEHSRLLRRFRASLAKLGCDSFEVYEQAGSNWTTGEASGRFVQIMRFRDRRHQLAVQAAERTDPVAQAIIAEFCQLINFPYQQQQGLFAVGFYNSALPVAPSRPQAGEVAAIHASEAVESADDSVSDESLAAAAVEPLAHETVGGEGQYGAENEAIDQDDPDAEIAAGEETVEAVAEGTRAEPGAEAEVAIDDELADGLESEELAGEPDAGPVLSAEIIEAASGEVGSAGLAPGDAADPDALDRNLPLLDDADELGALLDAHVNTPVGEGAEDHPLSQGGAFADDAPAGLDALDLADLDLPDDRGPQSQRASKHLAR